MYFLLNEEFMVVTGKLHYFSIKDIEKVSLKEEAYSYNELNNVFRDDCRIISYDELISLCLMKEIIE